MVAFARLEHMVYVNCVGREENGTKNETGVDAGRETTDVLQPRTYVKDDMHSRDTRPLVFRLKTDIRLACARKRSTNGFVFCFLK